jgi:hypothetical protein
MFLLIVLFVLCSLKPQLLARLNHVQHDETTVSNKIANLDGDICSHTQSCRNEALYGNATFAYSPSRGYFPAGCTWREVQGLPSINGVYEYWNPLHSQWQTSQPSACRVRVRFSGEANVESLTVTTDLRRISRTRRYRYDALRLFNTSLLQVQAVEVPKGYRWGKLFSGSGKRLNSPVTAVEPQGTHTIMKNLWYNNGRCAFWASCTTSLGVHLFV